MATKNKTTQTEVDVSDFIESFVENDQKKEESHQLIKLMKKWSGFEPKMWGPTIIGFGTFRYKYDSGREGDSPLIAFSPRKAEFSLYVVAQGVNYDKLLAHLGKFKMGKSCIYFKKLDDLNLDTLEKISKTTIRHVRETGGHIESGR